MMINSPIISTDTIYNWHTRDYKSAMSSMITEVSAELKIFSKKQQSIKSNNTISKRTIRNSRTKRYNDQN